MSVLLFKRRKALPSLPREASRRKSNLHDDVVAELPSVEACSTPIVSSVSSLRAHGVVDRADMSDESVKI